MEWNGLDQGTIHMVGSGFISETSVLCVRVCVCARVYARVWVSVAWAR